MNTIGERNITFYSFSHEIMYNKLLNYVINHNLYPFRKEKNINNSQMF